MLLARRLSITEGWLSRFVMKLHFLQLLARISFVAKACLICLAPYYCSAELLSSLPSADCALLSALARSSKLSVLIFSCWLSYQLSICSWRSLFIGGMLWRAWLIPLPIFYMLDLPAPAAS